MVGSHPMNNSSIYHPQQLTNSCQLPADTAAPSMTLQQKIYRLTPIDFEKPMRRELPAYIDVNDSQWAVDPRVRPGSRTPAVPISEHVSTSGIGVSFYSSGGAGGESDRESVVQQYGVSGAGSDLSSIYSYVSSHIAALRRSSDVDCSLSTSSHCTESSSVTSENSPNLPCKLENLPVGVVKTETIETRSAGPAARHMFQHNVSWLSVARSSGVQKLSDAKSGSG